MAIPDHADAATLKRITDYNARTLELFRKRQEKSAARRKERAAARKAEKEANADVIASVKVGDVFYMSWGYGQTNVDFFQVVSRTGNSVRVRQVAPAIIQEDPGMMCADRVYKIPQNGEMLPKSSYTVFIKDQERGDLKRIQVSDYFNEKKVYLNIGSHYAYKETEPTAKHYVSWYA